MTALKIYKAQYEEERTWYPNETTKYEWVADRVFDLTTYDGELDELFVKDILEVCEVILENRNYEYILDKRDYIKFILVCQLLDKFGWIEWGTSIRGSWFENSADRAILEGLEWSKWDENERKWVNHTIPAVIFSKENLKALIEFMEES